MKNRILIITIFVVTALSSCNDPKPQQAQTEDSKATKKIEKMNNLISIVEIPVADFLRAVQFYQTILGVKIEEVEMDGVQLGVLPNDEGTVNVVLAKGSDYKPSTNGALLYLNSGEDLQPSLDKIGQNGGQVILPKTAISPEMGFFALFIDSEGNKMGLHSMK